MKEYKKVLKHVHIDNSHGFSYEMDRFLREYPNIKIEHIITHKPYHISIIFSEMIEVK